MKLNLKTIALSALVGATLVTSAIAQTSMGPNNQGQGYGNGARAGQNTIGGMMNGGRGGYGGGHGMMRGHGMMGGHGVMQSLISKDEWVDFQTQMRATKTYDECKTVQTAHWGLLETRAKEKNMSFDNPTKNGWGMGRCDMWRAQGILR